MTGSPALQRSGSTTSLTSVSTISSSAGTSTVGAAERKSEGYGDYESFASSNGEPGSVGSGSSRAATLAEALSQGATEGPPPDRHLSTFRFGFKGGAASKLKKEQEKQAKKEKKERKAREKEASRLLASHSRKSGGSESGSGSGSGSAIYLPSNSSTSNVSVLTSGKEFVGTHSHLREQPVERIHSSASSSHSGGTAFSDQGSPSGVSLGLFTGACFFNGCPYQSKTCPYHNKKYRKKLEEAKRLEESMKRECQQWSDSGAGGSSVASASASTADLSISTTIDGSGLPQGARSQTGADQFTPTPTPTVQSFSPPPLNIGGSGLNKPAASTSNAGSSSSSSKSTNAFKRIGNGLTSKSMVSLSREVFDGIGNTLTGGSHKKGQQEKRDRENPPLKISDPIVPPVPLHSSSSTSSVTSSTPRIYSPINDSNYRKRSPSVNAIDEAKKISQAKAIFPPPREVEQPQPQLPPQETRESILYRPPSVAESTPLPRPRIRDSQLYAPLPSYHPLAPPPPAHQNQKRQKEKEKEKDKEGKTKKAKNKDKGSEGVPLRMGFLDFGQQQDGFMFIPNHHRTMQSLQQAPSAPLNVANILHAQELEQQQEQLQQQQQRLQQPQNQGFNSNVSRHIISPNEIALVIEQEAEEIRKRQERTRLAREQELQQQRALEDEEAAAAASGSLSPPGTQQRKKSICSLPIELPMAEMSLDDTQRTSSPQGAQPSNIIISNISPPEGVIDRGPSTAPLVPSPSSTAPWMQSIPPQLPTGPRPPPGSRSNSFTTGTARTGKGSPDARARYEASDYFGPQKITTSGYFHSHAADLTVNVSGQDGGMLGQAYQSGLLSPNSPGSYSMSSPALTPSSISTVETSKTFGTPASPSSMSRMSSPTASRRSIGSMAGSMSSIPPMLERRSSSGLHLFMDHYSPNVPPVPPVPNHHAMSASVGMHTRTGSEASNGGGRSNQHGGHSPSSDRTPTGPSSQSPAPLSPIAIAALGKDLYMTPTLGMTNVMTQYRFPDTTASSATTGSLAPPLSPSARQQLMATRQIILPSPTMPSPTTAATYKFPAPKPTDEHTNQDHDYEEEGAGEAEGDDEHDDGDEDVEPTSEPEHVHKAAEPKARARSGRHSLDKEKRISFIRKGSGCSTLLGDDDGSELDDYTSHDGVSGDEDYGEDEEDGGAGAEHGDAATGATPSVQVQRSSSHRRRQRRRRHQEKQSRHHRGRSGSASSGCTTNSARKMSEGYSSSASLSSALSPPQTPLMEYNGLRKLSLFTAAFNGRPPPPLMTTTPGASSLSQVATNNNSEVEDEGESDNEGEVEEEEVQENETVEVEPVVIGTSASEGLTEKTPSPIIVTTSVSSTDVVVEASLSSPSATPVPTTAGQATLSPTGSTSPPSNTSPPAIPPRSPRRQGTNSSRP
ncbi:hypothetical protein BGW41_001779 [Actinomortierella wolfii]|nr:hypothetical protein BGW41_001779 [Actinomortierella wolfii]